MATRTGIRANGKEASRFYVGETASGERGVILAVSHHNLRANAAEQAKQWYADTLAAGNAAKASEIAEVMRHMLEG